jgi:hypothetical protein
MLAKLEQRRRGEISPAELVKWHGEPRDAAVKEARETFMTEMVALLELFHRGEITGEELYGPFKELQLGGPTQSDELFEITGDVESALELYPSTVEPFVMTLDDLKKVVERNLIKLKDMRKRDAY